ncbi:hypothetical protein SNEBB_004492 [Seison nebaliae]|nr:hypothetical protein SNEBB_004492 [Seison nebaliae]
MRHFLLAIIFTFSIITCKIVTNLQNVDKIRYEIEELDKQLKLKDYPLILQEEVARLKSQISRGDNSHFCCASHSHLNNTDTIVLQTVIKHVTHIHYIKLKVGHEDCGFLGATTCTRYAIKTKIGEEYIMNNIPVTEKHKCDIVSCCKGYVDIAKSCIALDFIIKHPEILSFYKTLNMKTTIIILLLTFTLAYGESAFKNFSPMRFFSQNAGNGQSGGMPMIGGIDGMNCPGGVGGMSGPGGMGGMSGQAGMGGMSGPGGMNGMGGMSGPGGMGGQEEMGDMGEMAGF